MTQTDPAQQSGAYLDPQLDPQFLNQIHAMLQASNGDLWVESGARTAEQQNALLSRDPTMAVPGDVSNHVKGLAADIGGNFDTLKRLAPQFGLAQPMDHEPWHVEPVWGMYQSDPNAWTQPPPGAQTFATDPNFGNRPANLASKLSNALMQAKNHSATADQSSTDTSPQNAVEALGGQQQGSSPLDTSSIGSNPLGGLASATLGSGSQTTTTVQPGQAVQIPNGTGTAGSFLKIAMSQAGKQYIYGADPSATQANPGAFDCEGLTRWAAARMGINIPAGATFQYRFLQQRGTTMDVQQALHTPGALLFHFGSNPDQGVPPDGHVGISVGDGIHVMQAKGHAYGTNVFPDGGYFNYAGMVPGLNGTTASGPTATSTPTKTTSTTASSPEAIGTNPLGGLASGNIFSGTQSSTTSRPGTAQQGPGQSGGNVTPQQVYQALRAQGLSPQVAAAFTSIAGRESGFNLGAHNGNAGTGDDSYGLFQINLINGEHSQFNPGMLTTLNGAAQAAAEMYNQSGFQPWGGYKGVPWSNGVNLQTGVDASGGEVTLQQLEGLQ